MTTVGSDARGLMARLSAARAERKATRGERAMKRAQAEALRLANRRGENNKGRLTGGGGG
jgi:hypothetical protein